ncbi:hypothetical protein NHH03_09330 [Stieleria sp. TO1_6]|uniref:hypothetical protein n=1 Tax=Stieleria tagensis TaxID=2956795 RepID=UPI00209AC834|nr:hypothetical protein [Stieleria tagensis]MCO8121936.1 hypothetical protein [Stieleria tagensis]
MSASTMTCPFCPLGCDDVTLNGSQRGVDVACEIAVRQFHAALNPPLPRLGDQTLDALDWERIETQLQLSDRPVVECGAATIEEAKRLESLASAGLIRIHLSGNPADVAVAQTAGRDGFLATTLGDLFFHADLVWVIGDVSASLPRLTQRITAAAVPMVSTAQLSLAALTALHGFTGGQSDANPAESESNERDSLVRLFQRLRSSCYCAIVIGDLPFQEGTEVIASEMLQRLLHRWNETSATTDQVGSSTSNRFRWLQMDAQQSLRSVLRWRHNQLCSLQWAAPESVEIRLGDSTVGCAAVQVQIGGPDPGPEGAMCYLPAGIPGVHQAATKIRGDGSVTLPLLGQHETKWPPRIDVLQRLVAGQSSR